MSDGLFHIIDGAFVILRKRGVFRQAKLYHREGRVYAQIWSGYIRLALRGGTSHPDVVWDEETPLDYRVRLGERWVEYAPEPVILRVA